MYINDREELNTTEEVNETLQTKIHRLEDDIKETAKKIKEYGKHFV